LISDLCLAGGVAVQMANVRTIRMAIAEDLLTIVELGKKFFEEAKLPGGLVPEVWVKNWTHFLRIGTGIVFVAEERGFLTGTIGGFVYEDLNNGHKILTEAFWYVDPDHRGKDGLRLLKAFESWAELNGCRRISMVHLHEINNGLGDFYLRRGYRPVETAYWKAL
jgi:GNAT superfamily N-acetyltransferase